MQSEVDGMAAGEAEEASERWLGAEREVAGQEEVADEADQIACDVSRIGADPQQQQAVDAVVDGRRQSTVQGKTYELPKLVAMQQSVYFFVFYHIHVQRYE